jgi:hypothetical protein
LNTGRADYDPASADFDWSRPEMLDALAAHDFPKVFRLLQKFGFTQNAISAYTRQSQPEVSAVIHGRQILAYDVIRRVSTGLGIPLCMVGMGSCCRHTPCPDHPASATITPGTVAPDRLKLPGGGILQPQSQPPDNESRGTLEGQQRACDQDEVPDGQAAADRRSA